GDEFRRKRQLDNYGDMAGQKYSTNDIFMPIWKRDYSDLLHGLTGLGSTRTEVYYIPAGVVGLISATLVGFMLLKGLARYPNHINFHLLGLLALDYLVISVLINIFLFSGSGFEVIYYGGAFMAGIYFFGNRVTSQLAVIAIIILIMLRLVYVDGIYLYVFWMPILILVYLILRAPVDSEGYRTEIKEFSFASMIGRS
ncbi:hypothetical protein, partial [Saccharospirillum sp.]|uniref:hypothetical protein n=1 Tax=Saccharospirillum sp. TaxID=2033801 RepID=UPI00349FD1DC